MWLPSQHSLPLQELSLWQMGHREWCPLLQLQQPAMLFQQIGLINCNDLDTFRPLSLIAGPRWLSICSFIFADLVARSFHSGRIAVTIGKYPLHSIARLQGKLPLSSVSLESLESFKTSRVKNGQTLLSFPSLPPTIPKKNLDTRWYECVHNCPQASGDFTGSSATSSWVALSGTCQAAETTCKCDPERLHKLLNKRALWEHSRSKAETKRWCDKTFLIKTNGESDCVARKTRTAKYGKHIYILEIRGMRGYIGTIRLRLPSQCSLPLQELSSLQTGHQEWCLPLVLERPRTLWKKPSTLKRKSLDITWYKDMNIWISHHISFNASKWQEATTNSHKYQKVSSWYHDEACSTKAKTMAQ